MRHQNPERLEILAGEYVLGTLRGRARRRFEAQLSTELRLRQAVARWEARLAPLALGAPAIEPPTRLRDEVTADAADAARGEPGRGAGRVTRRAATPDVGLWRGLALVASAAALTLALLRAPPPPAPAPSSPTYVAVLLDPKSAVPAFVLQTGGTPGVLRGKPLRPEQIAADRAFELWLLPPGGAAPRSLGLLSATEACTLRLPPEIEAQLRDAAGLAVSLEPAGGSPTGAPTGPVLYHGPIVSTAL